MVADNILLPFSKLPSHAVGFAVSSGHVVDVLVIKSERTEMCAFGTEQPVLAVLVKKTLLEETYLHA